VESALELIEALKRAGGGEGMTHILLRHRTFPDRQMKSWTSTKERRL
jgi:hypothetical protein